MPRPSSKARRNGAKRGPAVVPASGAAGRLIVTYTDGTWTDNLAIRRYSLEPGAKELVLAIEVAPRERPGKVHAARAALREFMANLGRIHTLQIGKPLLAAQLREQVRASENASFGVRLSVDGRGTAYPAGLAIGPDEVVLNLG